MDDPSTTSEWPPTLERFNYIKLHGSWDWRSADNRELLVIGGNKTDLINQSPLLSWYRDVFQAVSSAGDVRLFISGYSFADEHINQIIAEAVEHTGLRVWIHNVVPLNQLKAILTQTREGGIILNSLLGYSSRTFFDIFPGNQRKTEEIARIRRDFFYS